MSTDVTFRAVAATGEADNSVVVTKPTGTVDDDVMLALFWGYGETGGIPEITPPASWTLIASETYSTNCIWALYWKRASTEGANYTWAHDGGGAANTHVVIASYYNVLPDGDPIDTFSDTAYVVADTTLRAATVTPSEQPIMLVFAGSSGAQTMTAPANFTERYDANPASCFALHLAERLYLSTDATGNVDATLSGGTSIKHAFLVALQGLISVVPTVPVITAPTASEYFRSGTVQFTCSSTDPNSDAVFYEWEVDTATPPVSTNDDYFALTSGYTASAADNSVYNAFDIDDRGTWYCRARASDGTYTSDWSAVRTFQIMQGIRLLPDTSIEVSTLECANKIWCAVDGTATREDATNTTIAPTYATSPREMLVIIKAGDATAAQAVADATLALRQSPRYRLTGLKVPLRYGLGIQRGQLVRVTVPRASIADANYAVRRVEHDFGANTTTIDVGEYTTPRDQEEALVRLAEITAKIEKEAAI